MPPPEMSAITFLLRAAFPAGREGRSGWRDREVMTRLESALEHSAALFLLALFVKFRLNLRLSVEELAGQAIAHDLHEGVAPDRNPARVFSKSMTRRQLRIFWRNAATRVRKWVGWETLFKAEEKKAMWELTEGMPRRARTAFRRWWLNYYEKRNPEAQLLRKLHPLVDLAKGFDYLQAPDGQNDGMSSLASFIAEAREIVDDPFLQGILEELISLIGVEFGGTKGK